MPRLQGCRRKVVRWKRCFGLRRMILLALVSVGLARLLWGRPARDRAVQSLDVGALLGSGVSFIHLSG